MRFGHGCLDIRDPPAADTREVMVRSDVGVEARSWTRQFTEQPGVDEQSEVPVDGGQAHPWRSAEGQSVDFLGSGVRLDTTHHVEHRAARNGQPEPSTPQCDLRTLRARWARIVRCPSISHLRDDSHLHQDRPDDVTVRGLALPVKKREKPVDMRSVRAVRGARDARESWSFPARALKHTPR